MVVWALIPSIGETEARELSSGAAWITEEFGPPKHGERQLFLAYGLTAEEVEGRGVGGQGHWG